MQFKNISARAEDDQMTCSLKTLDTGVANTPDENCIHSTGGLTTTVNLFRALWIITVS
jgi:hypothetical protein